MKSLNRKSQIGQVGQVSQILPVSLPVRMKQVLLFLSALALAAPLASCSKGPSLKGVKVARTSVESTITTISTGTVEAIQQAVLGFSSTGRISRIPAKLGQKASRGQVLAELDNTDLKAVFEDAQKETGRTEQLFKEGLVAQAALDTAKKNLEVAHANLDKTVIRAPFDGIVTELNIEVGELAQLGAVSSKAPLRLIDLKPRIVRGQIDEVDIGKVRAGTQARVKVNAFGQQQLPGKLTRVVPFVSSNRDQDRTSEIEVSVETGTDQLLPVGASADVEMVIDSRPGVLAVPTRVILGTGGQRYVYKIEGSKIVKTPVTRGAGNYDRTQIETGLSEGDTVVFPSEDVDLKDGMSVRVDVVKWP